MIEMEVDSWTLYVVLTTLACVQWKVINGDISNNTHHRGRHAHRRLEIIEQVLATYDKRIPPNFESDEPLEVRCNMYIAALDSISFKNMEFRVSFFMRQRWNDPRLTFEPLGNETMLNLDSRMANDLWTPDLIFLMEKKGRVHDITVPNKLIRMYSNGDVLYSMRLSLTIACAMALQKFPLDTQICGIEFESFGYTRDRLEFVWDDTDPVLFNKDMQLAEFRLTDISLDVCHKSYTTGEFPCLLVHFALTREIGFYMIQTFVPSALIVMLSWVSFWINADAVPGRVTLGVSTVLTITTQNAGARQGLPHVSYVRAIDVWMTSCMAFVFGALVEYAFVNVLSRREVRKTVIIRQKSNRLSKGHVIGENGQLIPGRKFGTTSLPHDVEKVEYVRDPEGREKARMVDKISRAAFPVTFAVFSIIYWAVYAT
ncbi:glycine receptor subunit alpha-3-like [Lineus longissimus]|uniref:glycine receptor subunit alpha-3-like n=1 Tax=Lineus longissimus TaxID=88925 RepID=UPI00315CF5C8